MHRDDGRHERMAGVQRGLCHLFQTGSFARALRVWRKRIGARRGGGNGMHGVCGEEIGLCDSGLPLYFTNIVSAAMTLDPNKLPSASEKNGLLEWLDELLPFKLPRIPLVRAAANLDKAVAMIVLSSGQNISARINSSTERIEAMGHAERALIELGQQELSKNAKPNLRERAIEHAIGDAVRRQSNREKILEITAEDLSENPPSNDAQEEIEDDWLDAFKRYSETKSNSDIQHLWARILSSEIRKPGTTSLRTLQFLSTASTEDAKLIVSVFTYVINGFFIPHIAFIDKYYPFHLFFRAQEIGVLNGASALSGTATNIKSSPQTDRQFSNACVLQHYGRVGVLETDAPDYCLKAEAMFLTEIGKNLFAITETKKGDYNYFDAFLKQHAKEPIKQILVADIIANIGERLNFINERTLYTVGKPFPDSAKP